MAWYKVLSNEQPAYSNLTEETQDNIETNNTIDRNYYIRWFESSRDVKKHAVKNRRLPNRYLVLKLRKLSTKAFYNLLQQISLDCKQGLSIKDSLISQRQQDKSSYSIEVILIKIQEGTSLKESIASMCDQRLHYYTNYLIDDSTHEVTLTMIEAAISELASSIELSKSLTKSLLYPFFVVQASFMLLALNALMVNTNPDRSTIPLVLISWATITLIQTAIAICAKNGTLLNLLERHSKALQLKNLFQLSLHLVKSGIPTHLAIKSARHNLRSPQLIAQALSFELNIRLGIKIQRALPKTWFDSDGYSIISSSRTGEKIEKALIRGYEYNSQRCVSLLSCITKTMPVLCLLVAGCLVGFTILEIYSPLLEAKPIGY
ncbi:hypothetical protein GV054_10105 [Marinomonas mediterranea]|jgi:hypothetical protein|uniref:Type II secretion system F domain n=1 Tax=Marinomonas mediterranea (strain ATCC 700492 / JCM 21426 / NBRC 103028 / MMB-1) TaxID=717774 RepID=F2K3D9_MARM1|nr:hypothetical protein [Marinomonas mediterranea]ADZ91281.1 hypothetical protein Marme_2033 [Marinomonas mediterranea MMB-1]WCN13334.1 hypothetical protein GV054_10105 [Marinomonas mediterranea]WCN17402.1 hypothetical protein GV053_10235 [Marinomonas mediterranea MMB-1]